MVDQTAIQPGSATSAIDQPVSVSLEEAELIRLFDIYKIANLNIRYYGRRAAQYETWDRVLSIVAGFCAFMAVIVLTIPLDEKYLSPLRITAAVLAGVATLLTGLSPLLGWATQAKKLYGIHTLYEQLFADIALVITDIRRNGLSEASKGAYNLVYQSYLRAQSLDELDPDQDLIKVENEKVKQALPPEYLWTHF